MRSTLDRSHLLKELENVEQELAKPELPREQRLNLLRRQAALGDLRDAIAERARRAAMP
ncbi:MAG: hypothetical protein QOJ21_548 [Solirubrobacteraceae bacterium]|jgi:hypothetical protein|nr:hypothetical protein [Solirubrobacteraceae bacterium]